MCLEKTVYNGFIIYTNQHPVFNSLYYSIYNPRNRRHVHINKRKAAESIVDCFYAKNKSEYGRLIRNRAMELAGYNVKF